MGAPVSIFSALWNRRWLLQGRKEVCIRCTILMDDRDRKIFRTACMGGNPLKPG